SEFHKARQVQSVVLDVQGFIPAPCSLAFSKSCP
ncbi:MAG: hypothetical protein ACI8ZB_004579, partial [Desulforhopalus sp.]